MTGLASNWDIGAAIGSVTPFNLSVSLDTANQILSSMDTSSTTSYQWLDCSTGTILVGDTGRTYLTRSGGTFAVILSNGNCLDTSACIIANFSCGGGLLPGEALDFDGINDVVQTAFPGV